MNNAIFKVAGVHLSKDFQPEINSNFQIFMIEKSNIIFLWKTCVITGILCFKLLNIFAL